VSWSVWVIDEAIYGPYDSRERESTVVSFLRMNSVPKRPVMAFHT